jgi:hypothetical protein
MPHVTVTQAVQLAEAEALNVWSGNTGGVFNTGAAADTYIYGDEAAMLIETWRGRGPLRGCNRRASQSSGEPKVDLKLRSPGSAASCFNYHIRFQARPSVSTGPTPEQVAASRRSNITQQLNALRRKEGKGPMTINWHGIPSDLP